MNKSENRRVGELAKHQQGNSGARANMEKAGRWTEREGDGGMEGRKKREKSKNKGSVITDEEADKKRTKMTTEKK